MERELSSFAFLPCFRSLAYRAHLREVSTLDLWRRIRWKSMPTPLCNRFARFFIFEHREEIGSRVLILIFVGISSLVMTRKRDQFLASDTELMYDVGLSFN